MRAIKHFTPDLKRNSDNCNQSTLQSTCLLWVKPNKSCGRWENTLIIKRELYLEKVIQWQCVNIPCFVDLWILHLWISLWILRLFARESQSRDFIMSETHPSERDVKSPHKKCVALFCTFSRWLLRSLVYGSHTADEYSTSGLTRVLYAASLVCCGHE